MTRRGPVIAELMGNFREIVRRHNAAWLPEAHPEAVEVDTPEGPVPMADSATANARVEAVRRGCGWNEPNDWLAELVECGGMAP